MSLLGLAAGNQLPDGFAATGIWMAAVAAIGVWTARHVRRYIAADTMRRVMLVLCAVSALMLIVRTLMAMH